MLKLLWEQMDNNDCCDNIELWQCALVLFSLHTTKDETNSIIIFLGCFNIKLIMLVS